jgi:hypothetical protein
VSRHRPDALRTDVRLAVPVDALRRVGGVPVHREDTVGVLRQVDGAAGVPAQAEVAR